MGSDEAVFIKNMLVESFILCNIKISRTEQESNLLDF